MIWSHYNFSPKFDTFFPNFNACTVASNNQVLVPNDTTGFHKCKQCVEFLWKFSNCLVTPRKSARAKMAGNDSSSTKTILRNQSTADYYLASFLSMEEWIERNFIIILTHSEQLLLIHIFHSSQPWIVLLVNSRIRSRQKTAYCNSSSMNFGDI